MPGLNGGGAAAKHGKNVVTVLDFDVINVEVMTYRQAYRRANTADRSKRSSLRLQDPYNYRKS